MATLSQSSPSTKQGSRQSGRRNADFRRRRQKRRHERHGEDRVRAQLAQDGHDPHARDLISAWVTDYNTTWPHAAVGYQTPAGFDLHLTTATARPAARDEYSFTVDVGPGGTVAVGVAGRFGYGDAIATSVIVGGVTATLFEYINSSNSHARFAIAVGVPAGTVEIAVTCSAVASRLGIHTWSLVGADATGAASVAVNGTSASIDAPAGGAVLAIGASINPASHNIDWTGLAERTEWTNYGDTFGSGAADTEFGSASVAHGVGMMTDGNFLQMALLAVPPR